MWFSSFHYLYDLLSYYREPKIGNGRIQGQLRQVILPLIARTSHECYCLSTPKNCCCFPPHNLWLYEGQHFSLSFLWENLEQVDCSERWDNAPLLRVKSESELLLFFHPLQLLSNSLPSPSRVWSIIDFTNERCVSYKRQCLGLQRVNVTEQLSSSCNYHILYAWFIIIFVCFSISHNARSRISRCYECISFSSLVVKTKPGLLRKDMGNKAVNEQCWRPPGRSQRTRWQQAMQARLWPTICPFNHNTHTLVWKSVEQRSAVQ